VSRRAWLVLAEALLVLCILAVAAGTFAVARAKSDGDEAEWIGTSRFFLTLFVERDLSAEAWPDGYWTRTQPMMARYVIGSWLWLRGHDLTSLNPAHNHDVSWAANQRAGTAPSNAILDEARMPMRALAALSVVLLYLIVRLLAGPVGGLAAALLALGSPYLSEHLVRAKGDTTLTFFMLLALLLAVISLRRVAGRSSLRWAAAAGLALGLAMGSKLTGTLGVLAVVIWAVIAAVRRTRSDSSRITHHSSLLWPAVVLVATALAFVLSNPFLYRDPIRHTWLMFEHRQEEMVRQVREEPYRAVNSLPERVERVWERSFFHESWGSSYVGWPIEPLLAGLGLVALATRVVRRPGGPELFVLLWAACVFAGVSWGLRYLLQHYFVPTMVTADLLAGVGVGWMIQAALGHVAAARRRLPLPGQPSVQSAPSEVRAPLTAKG
jgi:4-amino-4-deoxy-L-arabinose transferase-like glycosyltransferase